VAADKASVLAWFKKNFHEHYDGRRAPFGIYTHASWFNNDTAHVREAYFEFVDYVLALPGKDAYIVSVKRGLEWQQEPATVAELAAGNGPASWAEQPVKPDNCDFASTCRFGESQTPPGVSERIMSVCDICPPNYPWLGNPFGIRPN